MIGLTVILVIFTIYQVITLSKKKMIREISATISITIAALSLGFYYVSNPYKTSFIGYILQLLKRF